jgi:hypothetical protein
MNEANLVKRLNWLATGDSFLVEKPIALVDLLVTASGIPCGAGTAPTSTTTGISFDDGETAILTIVIPADYDTTGNRLALKFKVTPSGSNGTTDIGVLTTQNLWRNGAAVDTTTITAASEGAQTASTNSREAHVSLDGTYQPGDTVQVVVDVNCAGTDELVVNSMAMVYGSCLAMHDDADRHRSI